MQIHSRVNLTTRIRCGSITDTGKGDGSLPVLQTSIVGLEPTSEPQLRDCSIRLNYTDKTDRRTLPQPLYHRAIEVQAG